LILVNCFSILPQINQKEIEVISFLVQPLLEQEEIMRIVEKLLGIVSKIEERYRGLIMSKQANTPEQIVDVVFEVGGFFDGMTKYHFHVTETGSIIIISSWTKPGKERVLSHYETTEIQQKIHELKTHNWRKSYNDPRVLDGTQWSLKITYDDNEKPVTFEGSNAYPSKWDDLVSIFGYIHEE
jgi:hypothetical protein